MVCLENAEIITFVKTLVRALGMPRDVEPKVTKTARLWTAVSEEKPKMTPLRESGRTF